MDGLQNSKMKSLARAGAEVWNQPRNMRKEVAMKKQNVKMEVIMWGDDACK